MPSGPDQFEGRIEPNESYHQSRNPGGGNGPRSGSAGHTVRAQGGADSRARLHEPPPPLGKWATGRLRSEHTRTLAPRPPTLARGAPHSHRLRPCALPDARTPLDPVQLHPAADDGPGPLFLRPGRRPLHRGSLSRRSGKALRRHRRRAGLVHLSEYGHRRPQPARYGRLHARRPRRRAPDGRRLPPPRRARALSHDDVGPGHASAPTSPGRRPSPRS